MPYSLNIYIGQMTTNNWEDFSGFGEGIDFENSCWPLLWPAVSAPTKKKSALKMIPVIARRSLLLFKSPLIPLY